MYNVSDYANNNQYLEDADMEPNNNLMDMDFEAQVQDSDNDNDMRGEERNETVEDRSDRNTNIKDVTEEYVLNSEDEKFDTTYSIEVTNKDDDYRNSLDEFNSEDDIENLEEEENMTQIVPNENKDLRNVVSEITDDSKLEVEHSSNSKDGEHGQSPIEILSDKSEDEEESNENNAENEIVGSDGAIETSNTHQELEYGEINNKHDDKKIEEIQEMSNAIIEHKDDPIEPMESNKLFSTEDGNNENVADKYGGNNESVDLIENEIIEASSSNNLKSAELDLGITFPVIINIAETEFLLVPFNKNKNPKVDVSHLVSLFDNDDVLKLNIEDFFGLVRNNEDLNEIHPFSLNKELVLLIPELGDLSITEDNIYTRDITIEDFLEAFNCLRSNSQNEGEANIPNSLSLLLTNQTRFITNFNNLSESIREGKGFDSLTKFNNAESESLNKSVTNRFTGSSYKRQSGDSNEDKSHLAKRIKHST